MNPQTELHLTMSPPLMGFPEFAEYTLKSIPDNPLFFTLEAADGPSFILTKPEFFFPDYRLQGNHNWLENKVEHGKTLDVFIIVTVPQRSMDMTANLLAPLLIDTQTGRVCQHVMYDSPYTTRHYLFSSEQRRHCG